MDVEYITLGKCSSFAPKRTDEYYKNSSGDMYDITFSTGKTLRENLASLFGYTGDSYKIPVTTSNNVDTGFKIEFHIDKGSVRISSYYYYFNIYIYIYNENDKKVLEITPKNLFGTIANYYSKTSSSATLGTSTTYYLDYIRSTDIIALGIRGDANCTIVNLPIIFVKNENNNWTCLCISPSIGYGSSYASFLSASSSSSSATGTTTYTNPIVGFKPSDTSLKTYFSINRNTTSGVSVSLIRFPDIWDSCLFNNLYIVLSGTLTSGSLVNIGGSEYKILGDSSTAYGKTSLAVKLY